MDSIPNPSVPVQTHHGVSVEDLVNAMATASPLQRMDPAGPTLQLGPLVASVQWHALHSLFSSAIRPSLVDEALSAVQRSVSASLGHTLTSVVSTLTREMAQAFVPFRHFQVPPLGIQIDRSLHPAFRDLIAAQGGDLAAASRLTTRMPWYLRHENPDDAAVRCELRTRAAQEQRPEQEIVEEELLCALWLVLGDREQPIRIRFGQKWLVTADGVRAEIPPEELPLKLYWRWLRKEVANRAKSSLLGRPYQRKDALRDSCPLLPTDDVPTRDPLEALLQKERVDCALAALSPRQSAVVLLGADGLGDEAIARRLGVAPGTVRVQRHKARKLLARA